MDDEREETEWSQVRHFFIKRFSGGQRTITIFNDGHVRNEDKLDMTTFRAEWQEWSDSISGKPRGSFVRPHWLDSQQFRADTFLSAAQGTFFVVLLWITTLCTDLVSIRPLVIFLLGPFSLIGILVQLQHAFARRPVTQLTFDGSLIRICLRNGKSLTYKLCQINSFEGPEQSCSWTIRFDDGYRITRVEEFSNAPILIALINRLIASKGRTQD